MTNKRLTEAAFPAKMYCESEYTVRIVCGGICLHFPEPQDGRSKRDE